MNFLNLIEIASAAAGLILLVLTLVFPRFGRASWMLGLMLGPAFASVALLCASPMFSWPTQESDFLSFLCLTLAGAGGCVASYALQREDYLKSLKEHRWSLLAIAAAGPMLVIGLVISQPPTVAAAQALGLVALGPVGYASAIYLLLTSVVGLANLEQMLRSADEYARWEIKFLLVGMAAVFAALIYIASQVLLYSPEMPFLPSPALRIFPAIFLFACLFIFQSWRRSTGKDRVVVSQGIVYSTITLLSVGVYLVTSSFLARLASQWAGSNIPIEPIVFLVSVMVLSALLLGTAFRHRVRRSIRRNLFSGNYDYRQLWMDATEKVRSIDAESVTATALAQLIHDALGSLDISVWLRQSDGHTMKLILARGTIFDASLQDELDFRDALVGVNEPVAVPELPKRALRDWPSEFLTQAKASLVVPLISSGRLVGLLTVGSDRTGRSFDREAREFLRVLAVHAASEFHKSELLRSLVKTREAQAFETFSTFLLHDLKNFASTLSLIAKNAARFHGNPDFQVDAFRSVFETAEKMKHLCNGLRTFSTTLAANKRLDDVNQTIRDVVEDFDPALLKRLHLDLGLLPLVIIDKQEFARVLQNLILNANDASPDGIIDIRTCVQSDGLVIYVSDKGKGIPKEFLEKGLFQPFHTTKVDGLGIGLFQSKKIIESHDGAIDVESWEGEGTVVKITLPIPHGETASGETSIDDTEAVIAIEGLKAKAATPLAKS